MLFISGNTLKSTYDLYQHETHVKPQVWSTRSSSACHCVSSLTSLKTSLNKTSCMWHNYVSSANSNLLDKRDLKHGAVMSIAPQQRHDLPHSTTCGSPAFDYCLVWNCRSQFAVLLHKQLVFSFPVRLQVVRFHLFNNV